MPRAATRLLALLELLQARRRLTGAELARRLEVDERTIRRDVARLAELGIPVAADRGRYGGYRILPGYKLPPLMLTDDEATAVVLGLVAARGLGLATTTTRTAADSAQAKIRRVLPESLRVRVEAVEKTLGLTLAARDGSAPETGVLLCLAAAAYQHRRVRMRYTSWRGQRADRYLDPYGLVVDGGRWYVTGYDHRRGEIRTFRLDRIESAELTEREFDPPTDVDPVATVRESLGRVPYTHEVEVLLETSLTEARRRIPATVATLIEADGGVVMRARAERLDGMAHMLAGLGWSFVIRKPDRLREAVLELAETLRASANRSSRLGSSA